MSLNGYCKLRYQVLERDRFTCQLCGQRAPNVQLEVDHIQPVSEGGTDDMGNLRATCVACNQGRGSFTVQSHKANKATPLHKKGVAVQSRVGRMDDAVYRALMRFTPLTSSSVSEVAHYCRLSGNETERALVRLNERGLAYRNYDGEWMPVDCFSREYDRRRTSRKGGIGVRFYENT